MKIATRFATPLLALAIAAAPGLALHAQAYGPPPQAPGGWDAPPPEYHDAGRRGFHDGVDAVRNDFDAHRRLDPHRNPLFHHPPVPGPFHDEYRNGFERGYNVGLQHGNYGSYSR